MKSTIHKCVLNAIAAPKPTPIIKLCNIYIYTHILFELVISLLFRPNPYTRMLVSTLGSSLFFCTNVTNPGKSPVESWFSWFSLICVFSVYLSNLSLVTFAPSPGPHGGGGPRRCGRPRPLGGRPRAPRRRR